MALATYKDLCIDARDAALMGRFWASALRLDLELLDDGDARLTGPTPEHTVWINTVPEAVTTKQRLHLDVRSPSVDEVARLGAQVVDGESFPWTVMRDPEGGEVCVFGLREGTAPGLMELVLDTDDDPRAVADWWGRLLGARVDDHPTHGFSYLEEIPAAPFDYLAVVPVPEPKTVKNRIHIDVVAESVDPLLAAGATVLRAPDDQVRWHVLADPWGNEFCAFTPA